MGDIFKNFLDRELHEIEASDPQMTRRLRARFWILIAAVPIVPISVLVLILTMLTWDSSDSFPPDLWKLALLHPFLSCLSLMIAMMVHKQAAYMASVFVAIVPQGASLVLYFIGYVLWAFDLYT